MTEHVLIQPAARFHQTRWPLFPDVTGNRKQGFQSLPFQWRIGLWGVVFFALMTVTSCSRQTRSSTSPPDPGFLDHETYGVDSYREIGVASWYGEDFHQKPTASGEIYDMYAMTAAHKSLPLGTRVKVTNLETGRSILVRINDRGPFVKDRILDLSCRAAKELGIHEKGTARVKIQCPYSESTLRNHLGYWVQLGAYRNGKQAEQIAHRLKSEFSGVRVVTAGSIHRIRIGPFPVEEKAVRICDSFRNRGEQAFVIRDLLLIQPSLSEGSGPGDSRHDSEE